MSGESTRNEQLRKLVCNSFEFFCSKTYIQVLKGKMTEDQYISLINEKVPYTFINKSIVTRETIDKIIDYSKNVYAYYALLDEVEDKVAKKYHLDMSNGQFDLNVFNNLDDEALCEIGGVSDFQEKVLAIVNENQKELNQKYGNEEW